MKRRKLIKWAVGIPIALLVMFAVAADGVFGGDPFDEEYPGELRQAAWDGDLETLDNALPLSYVEREIVAFAATRERQSLVLDWLEANGGYVDIGTSALLATLAGSSELDPTDNTVAVAERLVRLGAEPCGDLSTWEQEREGLLTIRDLATQNSDRLASWLGERCDEDESPTG